MGVTELWTGMPDKEAFLADVERGLSIRDLGAKYGKSTGSIRHWLAKFGVKTKGKPYRPHEIEGASRLCRVCGKEGSTHGKRRRWLCAGCYTKVRRYRNKVRAIEMLGGKCKHCNWSGNIAGYQFHHRDGKEGKEFALGVIANKAWNVIVKEIAKCDLLCATCHQIEHSNNESEAFLDAVKRYQGRDE